MSSYIFPARTSLYRVTLHDTYKRDNGNKAIVRYSLKRLSDNRVIFSGRDLHCSPFDKPAGKACAISLLSFLTCTPDDIEDDYFKDYTPEQLDWCQSDDAQDLSLVVNDYESNGG